MGMIDKEAAIKAVCKACYMYKYIGEHHKDCKYYPCDDVVALEAVPEAPSGDLISRADAIEAVENNSYGMGSRASIGAIKALPSVVAVQVVRCKDCKWNMDDYMGTWCSRLRGSHGTKADDFCSYGERKGGEDE